MIKYLITIYLTILILLGNSFPQEPSREIDVSDVVTSHYKDITYGQFERNVLDLWLAKSNYPTPVVVFFHGGGFRAGDKSQLNAEITKRLLEAGISVVASNYRLSTIAPFPAQMLDAARAVQFLRSKAKEWNLDIENFAAFGGSAGAGISLWLAFHDDLADPDNKDQILRFSTRLTCAATMGAQTTYDPKVMKQWFGGQPEKHPALLPFYGVKSIDALNTPEVQKLMDEASPINHLTADDCPVFLHYSLPNDDVDENTPQRNWAHHPRFGIKLQQAMEKPGIECAIQYPGYKNHSYIDMVDFLVQKLKNNKFQN